MSVYKIIFLFIFFLISACAEFPFKKERIDITIDDTKERDLDNQFEKREQGDKTSDKEQEIKGRTEKIEDLQTKKELLSKEQIKESTKSLKVNKEKDKGVPFPDKVIKIGLLVPLSGPSQEIGISIYKAAELAVFETSSEKILLLPRDTGGNIETALSASRELEKEGVSILIGPLFSSQAKIIRENINPNIPVFSFTNDESITGKGLWSFGFSPQQQIKAVIKEIKKNNIDNIAVILPNTAFGLAALQTLNYEESLSRIKIKKIFRYFPESNDLTHLNKSSNLIQNIDYQGLLILASGQQLREISSRVQFIGVDPKEIKFFGLSGWNSTNIFGEPSLYGGLFIAPDQKAYEAFVSRYYNIYGEWPSEVSALGYDIIALSSYLISEAKQEEDLSNLAISSEGFKGLFGYFKLGANGQFYRKYVVFKVMDKSFLRIRDIMPDIN